MKMSLIKTRVMHKYKSIDFKIQKNEIVANPAFIIIHYSYIRYLLN